MKKCLTLALSIIMICFCNVFSFAAEVVPQNRTDDLQLQKQISKNVTLIEQDIESKGTSVLAELNSEKNRLSEFSNSETDVGRKTQINDLIKDYTNLIDEYKAYNKTHSGEIVIDGIDHPVLSPAVAAIVAWFISNKYYLSAELLTHAKENSKLNSSYRPVYGQQQVGNSKKYKELRAMIRSSGKTSGRGSSRFEKLGTTVDNDLYYAIKKFTYHFSNYQLTITDRYDYDATQSYEGIQGTAVNTMYMAQELGVIVPFKLTISIVY